MAYADTTYADAHFLGSMNEDKWAAVDVALQPKLLDSASKYIDVAFKYSGTQTDELLAFPRSSCVNACTGITYGDTVVPEVVKVATCEIALQMNEDESVSSEELNSFDANIKKEKVDVLEVEYKDSSSSVKSAEEFGYTWLRCVLVPSGSVGSFRVRKG